MLADKGKGKIRALCLSYAGNLVVAGVVGLNPPVVVDNQAALFEETPRSACCSALRPKKDFQTLQATMRLSELCQQNGSLLNLSSRCGSAG